MTDFTKLDRPPLTYVTFFLDAYEDDGILDTNPEKQMPQRIARFRELASTGIHICLYTTAGVKEHIEPIVEEFPNIHWTIVFLEETFVWKTAHQHEFTLPDQRSKVKDNAEFIIVSNCKAEFMEQAIQENPWNSTHFAWIDFSIFYVFHNKEKSTKWLQFLSTAQFAPRFITFAGCEHWSKLNRESIGDNILNRVYWRFCGGFFMGDKDSLLEFCNLYNEYFPIFMNNYQKLVWEVNFWTWLEANADWSPIVYNADHNDSILYLSADYYVENADPIISKKCKYNYPEIPEYKCSSACYIEYKGQHILNTRYVNYFLYDNGSYHIHSPDHRTLNSMNFLSILDDDFNPTGYEKMLETYELPDCLHLAKRFISRGVEDIRLYEYDGRVKFVATTIQYSPLGQNRIVVGEYSVEDRHIHSVELIEPPNPDVWCEKNWIPISIPSTNILDTRYSEPNEEYFIYGWSPFQIGKLVEDKSVRPEFKYKLEIVFKREYPNIPFLDMLRGSTSFIPYGEDRLVGVAHFSEEYIPRHYYHMMIQLDRKTMSIVEWSSPFYFQNIGIEFCIGFTVQNDSDFRYWISQFDRNPLHIVIPGDRFTWNKVDL
jgi:hypothetical protein